MVNWLIGKNASWDFQRGVAYTVSELTLLDKLRNDTILHQRSIACKYQIICVNRNVVKHLNK